MWASIALGTTSVSTSSYDNTSFSSSSVSSYSSAPGSSSSSSTASSSLSGTDDYSSTSSRSFASDSTSTTAPVFPPAVIHTETHPGVAPKKSKKYMLLPDYSKKSCSGSRGSFQLGGSSSHHTSKSSSSGSLSLSNLPYGQRRTVFPLSSSTSRLQQLMVSRGGGLSFSAHGRDNDHHSSRISSMGTLSSTFTPRRTLLQRMQRKKLIETLDQAVRAGPKTSNIVGDAAEKEEGEVEVQFLYKKNSRTSNAVPPPTDLKRATSKPLEDLLKEARRKNLMELINNPASSKQVNRAPLAFHPVKAAGVNQRRRSYVTSPEHRAMAAAVAVAAAAKAAEMASFHEGVRDFNVSPMEQLQDYQKYDVTARRHQSTPKKCCPENDESQQLAKQAASEDFPSKGNSARTMGKAETSLQKSLSKRKLAMRRSASAPRNSLLESSLHSKSPSTKKRDSLKQGNSEIAALQALAGGSSSSLYSAIPKSITLRRASSDESCFSTLHSPKSPVKPVKKLVEATPPMPTLNRHNSMDSVVNKKPSSNIAPFAAVSNRRKGLKKRTMVRRGSQNDITRFGGRDSITDLASREEPKEQKFRRAASFSSRKSLSLMVENANLRDEKLFNDCSAYTAMTAEMDTSTSDSSVGMGATSFSDHRRRRMLTRVESSASRKSTGSTKDITTGEETNSNQCEGHKTASVVGKRGGRQGLMMKQQSFVTGSRIRRTLLN